MVSYSAMDSILCPIIYRVYVPCAQISHKHAEPRTASSATLPLHGVHRMYHIPLHSSTPTNQQMHASKVPTQTKQGYSTWPSVGKDNPGWKLEPLDLASTPTDVRYAMKLPLHKPMLSSLRSPATKDDRETPPGPAPSSSRCTNTYCKIPSYTIVTFGSVWDLRHRNCFVP
jgi:hypothetical protein